LVGLSGQVYDYSWGCHDYNNFDLDDLDVRDPWVVRMQ
jgi:hypothetical protein